VAAEIQGEATANGLAGLFIQESNDWYAWYFERQTILYAAGTANQSQSGTEATTSVGTIAVEAQDNIVIALLGIESASATESVSVSTSSSASITPVQSTSSVATIAFPKPAPKNVGGQTILRPKQDRNAVAKIKPVLAVGLPSKISAAGTKVENASAQIVALRAIANTSEVTADGVLDISDDEVLLLLAA
jgi:hypothetical protein